MEQKILSANTYADAFDAVLKVMRARTPDLNTRHILFVPDKYTLNAERRLYEGTSGAFDAEVLTLNRLFFRLVEPDRTYLPKQGAVLLTRQIADGQTKPWSCFSRSVRFSGFAEKLYETMAQLIACRIEPEALPQAGGALGKKLGDIKSVYAEYVQLTQGKYVDSGGRMELLLSALSDTTYFNDTVVYFACFDSLTAQSEAVISAICKKAKASYLAVPDLQTFSFGETEVYAAADRIQEIKAVARRIRNDGYEGILPEQICVVSASPDDNRLARIFTEFGIPFTADRKYVLGFHPLCRFLQTAFACADYPRRADMLTLSKNYYTDIPFADADAFENYCNRYLVDYRGFFEPFDKGFVADNGLLSEAQSRQNESIRAAERVRGQLVKWLMPVRERLSHRFNANVFADTVRLLLRTCDAQNRTKKMIGVPDLGDICLRLESVLTLLIQVYGTKPQTLETLGAAFFESLESSELSPLPPVAGTVSVGTPDAFRGARFSRIYVIGLSEGILPKVSPDGGILSDREIDRLKDSGLDMRPKIADVNERAREELLSLLSSGDKLFLGVPAAGEERPSSLLPYITARCLRRTDSGADTELLRLVGEGTPQQIARHVSVRAYGRELLALGLFDAEEYPYKILSETYEALGGSKEALLPVSNESHPQLSGAAAFFFGRGSTTISRIQEYFTCPYRHFLKYGLGLKPREDGALSPLDIGNFLHTVIEKFVEKGDYTHIDKTVDLLVEQTAELEVKYRLEANGALIRQIADEAKQIAAIVAAQIMGGTFAPMGQEIRFSAAEKPLRTVKLPLFGRTLALTGIIDRADRMGDYARVVDYKTGQTSFSFDDLYYGRKIQLALYMRVLEENGFLPAGMFYFPFAASWGDDAFSHRLSGVFNKNPDLLCAMDSRLSQPGVKSEILPAQTNVKPNKDGTPVLKKSAFALTTDQLHDVAAYALAVLKNGAEEIGDGNVAPSPCKMGEKRACDYCEVRAVCNFTPASGRDRMLPRMGADAVLMSAKRAAALVDSEEADAKTDDTSLNAADRTQQQVDFIDKEAVR